jgi:hypothetical protein
VKQKLSLLVMGLVVVALLMLGSMSGGPAKAAPPAAPTPVTGLADTKGGVPFRFQPATALTADTATGAVEVMGFDALDVQYVIDQGTVNTVTLTIQYSNDGSNWVNGPALVSSNAADAGDLTRFPVFGRFARINQDVANTNPLTVTLLAVGR